MSAKLNRFLKWIFGGVPVTKVAVQISQTPPSSCLEGKVILITGGGRGIGYTLAEKFHAEGAKVILCGRNLQTLEQSSAQLNHCPYLSLDVSQPESFSNLFQEAEKLAGNPINVLVSNAGISLHEHSFEEVKESDFDQQFDTNLKGPYFLCQTFVKYLMSQPTCPGDIRGKILFISSERGFCSDTIPYGLTKAALNSFMQGLAKHYISKGIRTNAIAPGVTASDMTQLDKNDDLFREDNIGGRALIPEEVAEAATFLLSDAASSINGCILPCNLGNHIK